MQVHAFPPVFGTRRALHCPAPERIDFSARDGAGLCLHHTSGGTLGPVVIAPGAAMTALTFFIDSVPLNLVEFLVGEGFDVWLFDWRTSPLLEAHRYPYTLDDVARYDWPAALDEVAHRTGKAEVSVLAHCLSASTLLLSLLRGYAPAAQIRTFVASQVGLHLKFTRLGTLKVRAAVDRLVPGGNMVHQRPADSTTQAADRALSVGTRLLTHVPGRFPCDNPACHRQELTFGALVCHSRINDATHALMGDLLPECLMTFLNDVAFWGRRDDLLNDADRQHLDRLRLPIHLISGSENRIFIPEATARTYQLLCAANGPSDYERTVYDGFGHLDCYIGEDAADTIWPDLAATLRR
jgi:alpha-beta hydrolase superfamily lysophospholipase